MSDAIVLCADDYGLSPAVSRAILTLAKAGRISALSCMTGSKLWPEHGAWLAEVADKVDIGLHFTLVDEAPLTAMPHTAPDGRLPAIAALIARSYTRTLDLAEIAAELDAQLRAFSAVMGRPPAHIDGHLHAHILPGVRDVVLDRARALSPRPWLRNVHDTIGAILRRGVSVPKAAFISTLGMGFVSAAGDLKDRLNTSFSGVYAFSNSPEDYGRLFARFVADRGERHVILCHPGEAGDPTVAWDRQRAVEYEFLAGPRFGAVLADQGLRIARFAEI
jgi:predicted glycoside hydrolase/deacetylase ChbG (UPF0249 family)